MNGGGTQTKNEEMRKGGVRGLTIQTENKMNTQNQIELKGTQEAHRLRKMG